MNYKWHRAQEIMRDQKWEVDTSPLVFRLGTMRWWEWYRSSYMDTVLCLLTLKRPLFFSLRKKKLEGSHLIFAKKLHLGTRLLLPRLYCNSSDSALHLLPSGRKSLHKGMVAWYQWLTIFKMKKHGGREWNGLIGNEKTVNQIVRWSHTNKKQKKTNKNHNLLFL